MEIIKSRQQSGLYKDISSWTLAKGIYAKNGIRGFFTGYLMQLYVFVPYTVY